MFNSFLTFGYEKAPMHLAPGLFDNFSKLEIPYSITRTIVLLYEN